MALLYCAIFMKESLILPSSTANKKEIVTREHVYQVKDVEEKSVESPTEDRGFMKIVRTSVLYIVEGIRTVVTPREGWRRALVLLGVFQVRPQYTCTLLYRTQISFWLPQELKERQFLSICLSLLL